MLNSESIILIGKAVILAVIGILFGFIIKHLLRKSIDSFILKKIFRNDINVYGTSSTINKILTEIIQWVIIILFINYSLTLFNFNFISNISYSLISEIPKVVVFLVILSFGFILGKIVNSYIKNKKIQKAEEIGFISEIMIISAFVLSGLEYIGIRATALIELYKVLLYLIGAIIIVLFIKYELYAKKKKKK